MISCSKFEREQHPRHGLVVLVPCLNEALGGGDHLRSSQDMANFESWRVLGELWMEHLAERLSHLVGLPGKRTDPYVGRHFCFQFKRKNLLHAFAMRCVSLTMSLSVLPTPEQLASMTSIADVRDYAEVTSTVLERCVGITGQCHCSPSLWGWSRWCAFDNYCQIFGSLSRLFKDKRCHLVISLQSRLLKLAISG